MSDKEKLLKRIKQKPRDDRKLKTPERDLKLRTPEPELKTK